MKAKRLLLLFLWCLVMIVSCDFSKQVTELSGNKKDYFTLGLQYLEKEEYADSIEYFTRDIQITGDSRLAYMGRAKAYLKIDKIGEAKKDILRAIDIENRKYFDDPNPKSLIAIADSYAFLGDRDYADSIILLFKKRYPKFSKARISSFNEMLDRSFSEGLKILEIGEETKSANP